MKWACAISNKYPISNDSDKIKSLVSSDNHSWYIVHSYFIWFCLYLEKCKFRSISVRHISLQTEQCLINNGCYTQTNHREYEQHSCSSRHYKDQQVLVQLSRKMRAIRYESEHVGRTHLWMPWANSRIQSYTRQWSAGFLMGAR